MSVIARKQQIYHLLLEDGDEISELEQHKRTAAALMYFRFRRRRADRNFLLLRLLHARRFSTFHYLKRGDLLPSPRYTSSWLALYHGREDRAYINTMGIDVATFDYILNKGFTHAWNNRPVPRDDVYTYGETRLGARTLDAPSGLGLAMHYLCSVMDETNLQMMFAIVPASLSRYLNFALGILHKVLGGITDARVIWPKPRKLQQYADRIAEKHPEITDAFGFMDGLNLPVQTSTNPIIERATFNGWLHSHVISNVLVFAPDGTIIWAKLNCPGSWHDSRVAQDVYRKLRDPAKTPGALFLIADTAFPRIMEGDDMKIKVPYKANANIPGNVQERREERRYSNSLVRARQAAEWGMRALQGCFSRLRAPMSIGDPTGRLWLLETIVHLHNLCTCRVHINQIQNVYMSVFLEGYDDYFNQAGPRYFPRDNVNDWIQRFYDMHIEEEEA